LRVTVVCVVLGILVPCWFEVARKYRHSGSKLNMRLHGKRPKTQRESQKRSGVLAGAQPFPESRPKTELPPICLLRTGCRTK